MGVRPQTSPIAPRLEDVNSLLQDAESHPEPLGGKIDRGSTMHQSLLVATFHEPQPGITPIAISLHRIDQHQRPLAGGLGLEADRFRSNPQDPRSPVIDRGKKDLPPR